MTVVLLLVAGAVGAVIRYLATQLLPKPVGVLAVNVVGSFAAGILVGASLDEATRLAALAGFCGALTTFSTLSVDTVDEWMRGRYSRAALSIAANLVLGVAAALIGSLIGGAGAASA